MGGVILNPILHPDHRPSSDDVFHYSMIPPLDMHVSHDDRLVGRKGGWC